MRTITQTVYKFEELSEEAKEKARQRYRNGSEFYYEHITDDAKAIAELMGIYIDNVYFSGFCSQGDGASFTGTYQYKKGSVKDVKAYAPNDTELHSIAKGLQEVQAKWFYKLEANISHSAHYYHSGCMRIGYSLIDNRYTDIGDSETELCDLLRSFADWIYNRLEKEYEYQNSDEMVDDSIIANEYEFFENGEMA